MKQHTQRYAIIFIVLLALGLRLPLLNSSFWLDEAAQALESARPLAQQLDIIPDFQPPLIHLLIHFAMFFSAGEWWLRLVASVIPSLLVIFVTYKIAQQWKLNSAGLSAALLLATSSFFIFYSQELRPYALPTLWAVLSWWSLQKILGSGDLRKWWMYFLLTFLGLYSSYLYPFLILSQLVWVVISYRSQVKAYLLTLGLACITFIPWLPTFNQQLQAGALVRSDLPGWSEVVSLTQLKSMPLVMGKFVFGVADLEVNPYFVIFGLAVLGVGTACLWQLYLHRPKKLTLKAYKPEVMLLCWIIVPLITAWIVSFWVPVIQPKRVLFLLPAVYLLIGVVATKVSRNLGLALIGVFLVMNLVSTFQYYTQPKLQRENWQQLQAELQHKYTPDNSIAVFAFPEPFASWRWYDQETFPTLSLGYLVNTPEAEVREQLKPATEKQFVIVFDYLTDLSDPDHKMIDAIESFGFRPIEVIDYPNIGFVRIYSRPGVTVSLQ